MRRWRTNPRKPRLLDQRRAVQLLARGGALLQSGSVWNAYRTQDARRLRVGLVPDEVALALETDGDAVRTKSLPVSLQARPGLQISGS